LPSSPHSTHEEINDLSKEDLDPRGFLGRSQGDGRRRGGSTGRRRRGSDGERDNGALQRNAHGAAKLSDPL